MPTSEYRCRACGQVYEYVFTLDQWPYPESYPCDCGADATRFFSRPPAMSPDPLWNGYWDQQLGRYITSRDQKHAILKSKGLVEVSAEEHKKGYETANEKEDVIEKGDPALRRAMEKAYEDTVQGNIEPVTARKVGSEDTVVVS